MAIYHFASKIIGRSSRNPVSALAYRTGTELNCINTGLRFDYSDKDVLHVELLSSENAPEWVRDLQDKILQNKQAGVQRFSDIVELSEKRIDAQVYRECEFALPCELNDEQNFALAREFIHDQFTSRGMLALASFHKDVDENTGQIKPHCHLLLTLRSPTETGLSPLKNREWNTKDCLYQWREAWANHVNVFFKDQGIDTRIDHRSYKDQGIDLEPQIKRGRNVISMEKRGLQTDKQQEWNAIRIRNLYRIIARPEVILTIVTKQKSVFSWVDVQKVLLRYVDDDKLFTRLETKLQNSSELIALRTAKDKTLYTTKEILHIETSVLERSKFLSAQEHMTGHIPVSQSFVKDLTEEQHQALKHLCQDKQLLSLQGYAGSGKSYVLSRAAQLWQDQGLQVIGLAPTWKAAENLSSLGVSSLVLHKFLHEVENSRYHVNPHTVLILDEAGMVDARLFDQFLRVVQTLNVKSVLVGDEGQLQPIQAGHPFKLINKILHPVTLAHIQRQRELWQQDATRLFGQGEHQKALSTYWDQGCIHLQDNKEQGFHQLLAQWWQSYQQNPSSPHAILTHLNQDIDDLNHHVRTLLKREGLVSKQDTQFTIVKRETDDWEHIHEQMSKKAFAVGDRIILGKNDNGLKVHNNMLGRILEIDKQKITIQLEEDADRVIAFSPHLYPYFDHAWATSIYKAQGSSFDHVFVWSPPSLYQNLSYVAFTRHKDSLQVYGSCEDFTNKQDFINKLSRVSTKHSSLDYVSPEQAHELMQQDERILKPLFEKLSSQLEAIGFVSREVFQHTWKQFLSIKEEFLKECAILKDDDTAQKILNPFTKNSTEFGGQYAMEPSTAPLVAEAAVVSQHQGLEKNTKALEAYAQSRQTQLKKDFCRVAYGYEQSEPYTKDQLKASRYIQRRINIEWRLSKEKGYDLHNLESSLHTSLIKDAHKEFLHSLKIQEALGHQLKGEYPHLTSEDLQTCASVIHTHQEAVGQTLHDKQIHTFIQEYVKHQLSQNILHERATHMISTLGLSRDHSEEHDRFVHQITEHYRIHEAQKILHASLSLDHKHTYHLEHNSHKDCEQHIQHVLQQEILDHQRSLDRSHSRGMEM